MILTSEQQRIHDGLKNIGQSLANFYLDGIKMIAPDCTILSKANMIAHAAREIDGGLGDAFAPHKITKDKVTQLPDIEKEGSGHFVKILTAVGKDDPKNTLANKWYAIAVNFHRIAHRKEIHSATSVDPTEIISLWSEYEKILVAVVGSFLSISNRLDVLLLQDEPQHDSLPILKNVLTNPQHAHYFFSRLNKVMWLKPLLDEGYFNPASAPLKAEGAGAPEPWHALKYLVNISSVARRNVKANLIGALDNIMTAYINATIELHPFCITEILQIIINVEDYSFTPRVRQFFEKYDTLSQGYGWNLVHGSMSEGLAEKLVKKKDKEGLKNLLDYFLGFTTYEEPAVSFFGQDAQPYLQKKPNVEDHFITELLRLQGKEIIGMLGLDAIRVAVQNLESLATLGSHAISRGSPSSIEPTDQTIYSHGWEEILVYFIRDYAPLLNSEEQGIIIDEMLKSKVQILQRLSIHLIRQNFKEYGDKWWEFVEDSQPDDDIYIHEPYILLRDNSVNFTEAEFEKAITWIEKINPRNEGLEEQYHRDFSASKIRRWFTALNAPTEKSKTLLEEREKFYFARNDSKIFEHPEFDSFSTSSVGPDFPMTFETFKEMTTSQQVDFIRDFKPEQEHDSSEDGLGKLLRGDVFSNPEKYLYSLDEFIPLHSLYLGELMEGFTEALRKDKLTDYLLPLSFIEAKLADKSIAEEEEKRFGYKKWFASSVAQFISAVAAKHEELNVGHHELERMFSLLLSMINTKDFQDDTEEIRNGYINHVLNSVTGRLYGAVIQLVRVWVDTNTKKTDPSRWPKAVKDHFTSLLSSTENKDKDFSIVLGMELPLIAGLDREWVESNFNEIVNEKNVQQFDYRLHTIFSGHYRLSQHFYNILKNQNVFSKAISHFTQDSGSLDNLILYGLVEWKVWRGHPEKDGIINEILDKKNPEQIKKLVRGAWEHRLLSPDEVIYLWKKVLPLFDELPELTPHYSILLWLFDRLPELAQSSFDLATTVIGKTNQGRDIYSFLRHLYTISNSNLEMTGKLILQVYTAKLATPFMEHELKKTVKEIYEAGFKDLADNICIQLSEQGSLVLKELYNEFN